MARSAAALPARRRLILVLVLVALLLGLAAGAVAFYGRALATNILYLAFDQLGIPLQHVDVRTIGFRRLTLGPTRLGGADGPAASSIEVHWRVWDLLHGRLKDLRIDGLTMTVAYDHGAIGIAGLPRGEAPGSSNGWSLPVGQIELRQATLTLDAGDAKLVAALDATVNAADHGMGGYAAIDARVTPEHGTAIHVTANLPRWHLADDGGRLQLTVDDADLVLPDKAIALSNIDARLSTGEATTADVSGELHDRTRPARFPRLAFTLQGRREPDALHLSGHATTPRNTVSLTIRGRHTPSNGRGTLDIDAAPIRFKSDGLQPADLFPAIGDTLRHVDGAVAARGTISWGKGFAASAAATLDNVAFESSVARISALSGKVALESLAPLRTPGVQHVTARLGIASLPPGPVDVRFHLPGDHRILIDSATYGIAGGKLALADVALAHGRPTETALQVQAVDLGTVLSLIDVDGLSGSGILDGRIPFRTDSSGVAIMAGKLAATGPGVLRYTGAALPDTGGASGDSLKLARQALADFHYTDLTLTLDRAATGEGSLLVNLKGANPAVLDNYPFVLNIRLDANFDRLAAILFNGYAAAAELLRRSARP